MKKFILYILIAFSCNGLAAQNRAVSEFSTNPAYVASISHYGTAKKYTWQMTTDKDHSFYQEKSRKQRTTGLILLGSGIVLSGIGLIISTRNDASFDQTETGIIIMGIGAASGIASIPFMILAHVNRNKARVILSQEKTAFGIPGGRKTFPGIGISMELRK